MCVRACVRAVMDYLSVHWDRIHRANSLENGWMDGWMDELMYQHMIFWGVLTQTALET